MDMIASTAPPAEAALDDLAREYGLHHHKETLDDLFTRTAEQLRLIARHMNKYGNTLQTTALLNELYIKLANNATLAPQNCRHFLGTAAIIIRNTIRDYWEYKNAKARDRYRTSIPDKHLDNVPNRDALDHDGLFAISQALEQLEADDPEVAEVATLRYLVGFKAIELAEMYGVSTKTICRRSDQARDYLQERLGRVRRHE